MTVTLRALTLSIATSVAPGAGDSRTLSAKALAQSPCVFCGACSGQWQVTCEPDDVSSEPYAACPLCALALRLDRPRIDEEAVLIWLPEMSQPVVNTMIREIHMKLRDLGEPPGGDDRWHLGPPGRHALHHARAALAGRATAAASRLGSDAPSDLASALRQLAPAVYGRRAGLLGGLRLLSRGHLFEAGADVYPMVVDTWNELARSTPAVTEA